jgi:hypothetical protein
MEEILSLIDKNNENEKLRNYKRNHIAIVKLAIKMMMNRIYTVKMTTIKNCHFVTNNNLL